MHNAADTPKNAATPNPRDVFKYVFLSLVLVGNLLVLAAAWQGGGERAWHRCFGWPDFQWRILDFRTGRVSLSQAPQSAFSLGRHLALTIGVPIGAVVADFFIIMSVGLHAF